jgi:hypothetical protein
LTPFDICDIMLSPYRIMIGPKAEFPSYIEVDTSEELSVLRTLLMSHEMSAGGAMELRRHAMSWPFVGNRVHIRSRHPQIVNAVCDAVASGTLVAAVALESDHANTSETELRAMASGFQKPDGRTENIAQMGFVDKLQKALEFVPDQMGSEFKAKFGNEIKGFFSPENLAITAAIIGAWVGSHAIGVGFIVDGALLAAAFWFAGWQAIEAFDKIGDFIATVQTARSESQLRQAAGMMAAALAILGIAGLRAVLRRAGPKINKGASGSSGTSPSKMKKRTERKASEASNAKKKQAGDAEASSKGPKKGDKDGDGSGGGAAPKKPSAAQLAGAKKHKVPPEYVDDSGNIKWPDKNNRHPETGELYPDGFKGSPKTGSLKKGEEFDRIGGYYDEAGNFSDRGTFAAPTNTPVAQRALPGSTEDKMSNPKYFKKYRVKEDIPGVKSGETAPWFGREGGGTQHKLPKSIDELLDAGLIEEI